MTCEEIQSKFHISLNQQQLDAVQSVNGPVLLLAVPGSGKTTVLVMRLGYMIHCIGIAPENILTVTYTVAAARDMANRFGSVFGDELKGRLEFRTINGICAKVIQYYGKSIGKSPFSLVTESEGTAKMLSDIFRRVEKSFATESDLKGIRTLITYIKNMMLTDEEIRHLDEVAGFKISEIYRAYCNELQSRSLMDYDDQMVYARNILRKSPGTLQHFQNKYSYICVDEAQDTSRIQHEIIRLLAGKEDNLFMVGDEDQSIYGFRAAYPQALLSFEKDHTGAKVLLMEENFRSDGKIVEAADRFIQKNVLRHEKHMAAARKADTEVQTIALKDRNAQYQYLVREAEKNAEEECRTQTAVLYRNNESALPLVDLLERRGIPYRIHNAELTFFTHRVVQDIRNIILFASEPENSELFLQIYYKISTYISKQDAIRICEISRQEGREILEITEDCEALPERTAQSCRAVRAHLRRMLSERAERAVDRIVNNMGYGNYLERMGISDSRLFILRVIAQYEDSPGRLVERLDELQLVMRGKQEIPGRRPAEYGDEDCGGQRALRDQTLSGFESGLVDKDGWQSAPPIMLSTIHSSKGLEYDTVYLMDVVDGIFPESVPKNLKAMDREERESWEEERRLFYVGITRARNRLFIFRLNQKSCFCGELTYRERAKTKEAAGSDDKRQAAASIRSAKGLAQTCALRKKPFSEAGFREFLNALGEGLIVKHKKLGEGIIVEMQKEKVVIAFGEEQRLFGLKTLYEYDLLMF